MLTRSNRAALCGLLLLAVAATGCGSSSKSSSTKTSTTSSQPSQITVIKTPPASLPHGTESLSAFEKRLTAVTRAAANGNCAPVKAFAKTSNLTLPCDTKARKVNAGFKVTGGATYGTGAVVDFTDAEVAGATRVNGFKGLAPTHSGNTGVYMLALSKTGRYVYIPAGAAPIFPGSYIGTKPNGWAGADSTAITYLNSVRDSNCAAWFKYTLTPKGMPQKQACQLGLAKAYAPLRQELKAGPVKLSRIGGNGFIYFYWLELGKRAGTLAVSRDQPPAPAFIALGTVAGPKQ